MKKDKRFDDEFEDFDFDDDFLLEQKKAQKDHSKQRKQARRKIDDYMELKSLKTILQDDLSSTDNRDFDW